MKIWEKVNNVTGNDSKSRYLVPYINAGSKFLLSALPEKFLWTIASESEINGWDTSGTSEIGVGSSIAYDKVLAVYRYDGGKKRVCAESPDKNIHIFDEASSLLKATNMFPKFYKLSGKIYIKPDPDYNDSSSATSYTKLGDSSATSISSKAGDKGVIVYSAPPIVDENTDSWILTEYENIVLFYAASLDHFRLASTYRDLCKTQVDAVVGTVLTNYLNTIPSLTLPSEPSGTLSFSINSALPVGFGLTKSLPSFSFSDSLPTDFAITASLPSSFNLTLSLPTMDVIGQQLPSDFSISSSLPSSFVVAESLPSDFSSPTLISSPEELVHSLNETNIADALLKAEQLIDGSVTTNNAQEWLDDEDSEMTSATIGVANSEINRAQGQIQKEKNKLEDFSTKVGQKFNKYQNDISNYSAEVQKESGRVRAQLEKYAQAVAKEDSRIKSDLSKYSAEVQKESNRITSELSTYQREVDKAIQKYQADLSKYTQEVQKEAQRTGVDINKYNAELAKEKTRVEMALAKWQASLSKEVQDFGLQLQAYQGEVQKEGSRIGSDVSKYQAEIQKASKDMEKQAQQFSLDMQNYQGIIGGRNSKFQADMQKANGYLQEAGTKIQGAQIYTGKSQQSIQTSGMFYQRAINELSAITGAVAAPQQQQAGQRQEQGAST